MQRRQGSKANPSGGRRSSDRDIVNLIREQQKQLHSSRGSAELQLRKPRRKGANESIPAMTIFVAGANYVPLVLAGRKEIRESELVNCR
jgi:hypothetical protein